METKKKLLVVVGSIAIIGASGFVGYTLFSKKDPVDQSTSQVAVVTTTEESLPEQVQKPSDDNTQNSTTNNPTPQQNPSNGTTQTPTPTPTPTPAPTPTPTPTPKPTPTPAPTPTPTPSPTPTPTPTPTPVPYKYKNGSFAVTVTYSNNHGSTNTMVTHITINNDVVTAAYDTHSSPDSTSLSITRNTFEPKVSPCVVGVKLDNASCRVAGATLTSNAFNNQALPAIRTNAKA